MKKTKNSSAINRSIEDDASQKIRAAIKLHQSGSLYEAKKIYKLVLEKLPNHFEALHLLATIYGQEKKYQEADRLFSEALKIDKTNPVVCNNYANILLNSNQLNRALEFYSEAIRLDPNYIEAFNNRAKLYQQCKDYEFSLADYDHVIQIKKNDPEIYNNKGNILVNLLRFDEALDCFKQSIELNPRQFEAYNNLGNLYKDLAIYDKSLDAFEQAIEIEKNNPGLWSNLGGLYSQIGKKLQAIDCYDKAINISPEIAAVHFNKGVCLEKSGKLTEAIISYDNCLAIDPKAIQAINSKGNCFTKLGKFKEALELYSRTTELDPHYVDGFNNQGVILQTLGYSEVAMSCYQKAIAVNSKSFQPYFNAGDLFLKDKKLEEALACYEYVIQLDEDYDFLLGNYLHVKMYQHDWQGLDLWLSKLLNKVETRKPVSTPFPIIALTDSPKLQKIVSEVWGNTKAPPNNELPLLSKYNKKNKIRLGYFSSDFHNHPTMQLMAELFECHDKNQFELIAFSYDLKKSDSMRERVRKYFDQFIDVCMLTDMQVAQLSRELEIDIAIDLKGYTSGARTKIFSYRAAPVQVNYLGYPGTMGVSYIDYIIADPILIPEEKRQFFSEKVAYLPNSYQVNDRYREISQHKPQRADVGLPEEGFIFCCFNAGYKLTPEIFSTWVRILKSVDQSILWLLNDSGVSGIENLKKMAARSGIDPNRLIFADPISLPHHLARCQLADLFLDNLPCNAHTTASDALWAGLPIITLLGEGFSGRVAASLISAVGMHDLITKSITEYENLAIELATNPLKYLDIKSRLTKQLLTSPLFDTPNFSKNLEALFIKMNERYQNDLPVDHIYVN